jgi:hypothetical protein
MGKEDVGGEEGTLSACGKKRDSQELIGNSSLSNSWITIKND